MSSTHDDLITLIAHYAHQTGAREVWRSWLEHAQEQGREVATHRMEWETLPPADRELAANIVFDLVWSLVIEVARRLGLGAVTLEGKYSDEYPPGARAGCISIRCGDR